MSNIRRKVNKIYRNFIKIIVFLSAVIVTITLFNRYSSNSLNLLSFNKLIPNIPEGSVNLNPLVNWTKKWGIEAAGSIILLLIIVKVVPSIRRESMIRRSDIHTVDTMTGDQFEDFLVTLFKLKGYSAKKTKRTRDHGADVVITNGDKRIVVQAKRAQGKITNSAVQEVVASKAVYQANEAMVITNSHYTDPAKELAKANDVILWDRYRLIKELSSVNLKKRKKEVS